ncbi:MAG: DUF6282 family protein [Acidobacteriota bacterium]
MLSIVSWSAGQPLSCYFTLRLGKEQRGRNFVDYHEYYKSAYAIVNDPRIPQIFRLDEEDKKRYGGTPLGKILLSRLALILCLAPLLSFHSQLPPDPVLDGIIDFHAHADPDATARSVDVVELARKAREVGMRGFVIKNHYIPTVGYAYLARKLVPGIEVFGGIVLNLPSGGINAAAVESMASVQGGLGRVVWMPTFDAENHVRFFKENRPFVRVSESGRLLPEVLDLLEIIAQKNLILETGHSSAAECLLLIQAARQAGVKHIIVTHAMMNPINMSVEQQKKAAGMGAF